MAGSASGRAVSLDGQTLAMVITTPPTLAVETWSLPDHRQLQYVSPIAPQGATMDLAGTRVIAANGGGLSVYDCVLCGGLPRLQATARARVTRSLTPAERAAL